MKKHQLVHIICYGRDCKNCKLKEYRKQHNLKLCSEVPFNFQFKYASELFGFNDFIIRDSIVYHSQLKSYMEILKMITCGVKYE